MKRPRDQNTERHRNLAGLQLGNWKLKKYVGCGKIGAVYRAQSTQITGWQAAVKTFLREPRKGWEKELRKVSQLATVDGVVPLHDCGSALVTWKGETRTIVYTVWEFIEPGRNLNQYLAECNACPPTLLLATLETILGVLHACRVKGVERHGDLHAGNILLGNPDPARLDASLQTREPIYVADFGYGTTGGIKQPKDDYLGLASIGNAIIQKTDWDRAPASDRRIIVGVRDLLDKLLAETTQSERQTPLEILRFLRDVKTQSRFTAIPVGGTTTGTTTGDPRTPVLENVRVGQFQVSEMLGDNWELWKQLFVPTVPARSRLLELDITTVVTGPRGCGKTMLFRRLSERLVLECGPPNIDDSVRFVALYVNANDFADAFAAFPERPRIFDARRLICYANLCILADLLAVESARRRSGKAASELEPYLRGWLGSVSGDGGLRTREDELERHRHHLETIKWRFPPGRTVPRDLSDLARHDWIRSLFSTMRTVCEWLRDLRIIVFIDDYSTPRVSRSMQRVLNRVFFQRSSDFVFKIATESATTFVAEDSSRKLLQDGDDYQMIDMGEESLFMKDVERQSFLEAVFARRLELDSRVPTSRKALQGLIGELGIKKTAFARMLRGRDGGGVPGQIEARGERRGATKAKALYHGKDVLAALWSGDTRIMIQLVQELVDEGLRDDGLRGQVREELQDRVFRNRGGDWLDVQVRNRPTDPVVVEQLTASGFAFCGGSYGAHLKAIVEAFTAAARQLLLGPTYRIGKTREVPRMAFRLEITDKFRIEGLEAEIYKDLIRYGLFLRDNRGKSVQGAMVPRLFLRRLLLPYCLLALSKRDSVQMPCEWFVRLLSAPDAFAVQWVARRSDQKDVPEGQIAIRFEHEPTMATDSDAAGLYDDLELDSDDDENETNND